jgi:hypothetical protein
MENILKTNIVSTIIVHIILPDIYFECWQQKQEKK